SFRIELHGDLNGTVSLDERTGLLQDYASTMAPYLLFQTLNPSGEPETIRLTFHINNNSTIRKL
ncbi:MAG: hypothetical protein KDK65_02880, partial [Chlamydiia bacterium]|nr:hypothetical protein [Chlamydiia bacterium]